MRDLLEKMEGGSKNIEIDIQSDSELDKLLKD
jgi:hypothetical protein